jgi:O-antigen/teichoic acid export membrane protein
MASYSASISDTIDSEASAIGAETASTATFVLIGKFSSIIFLGLAFIALARLLGPSGYGIYALALAVSGLFGSVGNLGVSTALNKFIPEHIHRKDKSAIEDLLANSFAVTLITGIAFAAISFAISGLVATYAFHNPSYTIFIELASISILSSMLFGASYSALLGFNKGSHIAAINTTQAVLQAGIAVFLVLIGFGPAGPIIGLIIGYSVAFLYSLYLIYVKNKLRMFVMPSKASIKKIFSFSLPVAGATAVQSLTSNLSLIVLGVFATAFVIGNFGVASRVNSLIDVISGSISVSLLAMFSTTLVNKKTSKSIGRFFNYTIYYSVLMLAPILFFIAVLAKPFSYVAFSGVYSIAPLYIAIMSIGTLAGLAGGYASTLLISAQKVKEVLKYNLIIAAVQLILLPIIIPALNGLGLIIILYAITPVLTDVLFIAKSVKLYKLNFDSRKLILILAANAVTMLLIIPAIIAFGNNFIPLLIVAAMEVILVYPIALGLLGAVKRKDLKIMSQMTDRVPVIGAIIRIMLNYTAHFVGM